jgi:tetratricopeptide (TPR) repeat protein
MAATAVVVSALMLPSVLHAQDARRDAASSMYSLAKSEFAAENYKVALEKLIEVQKLDPNPVILYNIGRCYEELQELAKAADYFQQAAADPNLPQALLAEVGKRLPVLMPAMNLRESFALVQTAVGAALTRSERASVDSFVQSKESAAVVPTVIMEAPEADNGPLFLWSGVALGGVGLVLAGVGAATDVGLSDPIDELMTPQTRLDAARTRELQDEIESGQSLATTLYVAGGAALVVGGALAVLGLWDEGEPEVAPTGWIVVPGLTENGVGVVVGSSF